MRPLAVLTAIVFGSAAAMSFGLLATLVVFAVLQGEHPEFSNEFGPLARSSAAFILLLIASGAALYAALKNKPWSWMVQAAMWLTLILLGTAYWPR